MMDSGEGSPHTAEGELHRTNGRVASGFFFVVLKVDIDFLKIS
jgi:hypothetical protein